MESQLNSEPVKKETKLNLKEDIHEIKDCWKKI